MSDFEEFITTVFIVTVVEKILSEKIEGVQHESNN